MENQNLPTENQNTLPTDYYRLFFTGQGSEIFKISLVNILFSILTLGFYYPWAKVRMTKYLYHHTLLADSPFEYHATPMQILRGYLKVIALIILIYALLLGSMFTFGQESKITFIVIILIYIIILGLMPVAIHGGLRFRASKSSWRNIFFGYRGHLKEFALLFYKNIFLTVVTFGWYGSWMGANLSKYIYGHLRFGNIQFGYCGLGRDRFLINVKGILLSIITLGLYMFSWRAQLYNYDMDNTYMVQDNREIRFDANLSGWQLFKFEIVNMILLAFTLGLAYPWIIKRTLNLIFDNVVVEQGFSPNSIIQTESDFNDASGEDFLDALDVI
jgi:uncharacterized membrane protein YjgN (DUF898 family)